MPTAEPIYDFLDPPEPGDAVATVSNGGVAVGSQTELGRLGHYRVISELGRGGMGYVFEAEDVKLKRRVALKVMNQKIAATAGSQSRFISEARAMAAIRHDNVATIFEVGQHGETPFMAMEMLAGQTVEALNREKQRLDYQTIIEYAGQISAGLAAAHARGIVHRDIKPANIWIEAGNGRIKILDFGLALAQTPVDAMAGRGSVIGTPGYLSPEQARSEPLDDRSDLYSLGAVLYELCTGKLPIHARSVHEQLIAILIRKPVRIETLNPAMPKPLCDLIYRCLRKEPRARFPSAESLVQALEQVHVECDRSSEVAQTIGKLKSSLDQVFVRSAAPIDALPTANPLVGNSGAADQVGFDDALAHLPAAGSLSGVGSPHAAGSQAAGSVSSGVSKAPLGLPPSSLPRSGLSGSMPVVRNSANGRGGGDASPLKTYLPLLAVVGCLLLALPIMTYAFTGLGRSGENVVVQPDSIDSANGAAASTSNSSGDSGLDSSIAAADNSSPNNSHASGKPSLTPDQSRSSGSNAGSGGGGSPAESSTTSTASNDSPPDRSFGNTSGSMNSTPRSPPDSSVSMSTGGDSSQGDSALPPGFESRPNSTSGADSALEADSTLPADSRTPSDSTASANGPAASAAKQPESNLEIHTISTSDGDGADAMVRIGSATELGSSNAIGIETRNGLETNHSYLRFDLGSIGKEKKNVRRAKLVLTDVNDDRAVGARLRIYAIDFDKIWPEDKIVWRNSFSQQGLDDTMTAIGSATVETTSDRPRQIEFLSDELAGFIRSLKSDTLTVVVAGEHENNLLRFVSKEQSTDEAPRLVLGIGPSGE